jgi:uncharacterized caspase-like protein
LYEELRISCGLVNHTIWNSRNKYAVLVGINKYIDNAIRPLRYCVPDVKALQGIIIDKRFCNYGADNVRVLIDDFGDKDLRPIKNNIVSSIRSMADTATEDDSILFYFSGHGLDGNGTPCLFANDSRLNILNESAIEIDSMKEILQSSAARIKIMILDACHSGALIGKSNVGPMTKAFEESVIHAPEGFAILSSCKQNQISCEAPELGHGVFSHFLTEALKGAADYDKDLKVTISDLNRYTHDEVSKWALRNHFDQNPTFVCKISGDIEVSHIVLPYEQRPFSQFLFRSIFS